MRFLKLILLTIVCLFVNSFAFAQELKKVDLGEEDKQNNVYSKYECETSGHYSIIKLFLYRDSTYHFTLNSNWRSVFSDGKWKEKKGILTLNSNLAKDNIPVKLVYSDSTNSIKNFKFGVIRNLKGEEMVDGLVAINEKSVYCAPTYGVCKGDFTSIDSIKFFFGSTPSSQWLKVDRKKYAQIIPVVQINFMISNYEFFENRKYQVLGSSLKFISDMAIR